MYAAQATRYPLFMDRDGYKVFIEAGEKERLDQYLQRYGVKHKQFLTRLVRWYLEQDDGMRKAIAGQLPERYELFNLMEVIRRLAARHTAPVEGRDPAEALDGGLRLEEEIERVTAKGGSPPRRKRG